MNKGKIERIDIVLAVVAVLFMFIFMICNPANKTFTLDEIEWTLKFVCEDSIGGMFAGLLKYGYNLPLSYLIFHLFYKLPWHGEVALLLPSMIVVIVGVVMLFFMAYEFFGRLCAYFVLLLSAGSGLLISQGGWKYRPYSFMFCFSVIVLYLFLKRLDKESNPITFLYYLFFTMLIYTHWFGILVCAVYGMVDLARVIMKKASVKILIYYCICGLCFLPWFILMMTTHTNNLADYWAAIPDINSFFSVISYLLSKNKILALVACISIVYVIYRTIKLKKIMIEHLLLLCILFTFGVIFVYSRFVNPDGSLYVLRYFLVFFPHLLLLMGSFLTDILEYVKGKKRVYTALLICITAFMMISAVFSYKKCIADTIKAENPYKEASKFIAASDEMFDKNVLVLTSMGTYWSEFYLRPMVAELPLDMASGKGADDVRLYRENGNSIKKTPISREDLGKYKRLYLFELHSDFEDSMREFLDENYTLIGTDEKSELSIYEHK